MGNDAVDIKNVLETIWLCRIDLESECSFVIVASQGPDDLYPILRVGRSVLPSGRHRLRLCFGNAGEHDWLTVWEFSN